MANCSVKTQRQAGYTPRACRVAVSAPQMYIGKTANVG